MKVLVGIPTSFHKERIIEDQAKALNALTYKDKHILFMDNSEHDNFKKKIESLGFHCEKGPMDEFPVKRISKSRNKIIDYALANNFDYIFFIDTDVLVPKDAIERFLSHNKEAICGIYFNTVIQNGKRLLIPGVYKLVQGFVDENKLPSMTLISENECFTDQLMKVISCGGGCLFLHKDVFSKIRFNETLERCEDRRFCIDMYKSNIQLYCDTSIKGKHFIKDRTYSWDKGKLIKN